MIIHTDPQGSDGWLAARRGVITASRFRDCRDFNLPTAAEKKEGASRGRPGTKLLGYAMDLARERVGGRAPEVFQNAAMRQGTEQEPIARGEYELETGHLVTEAGFITTDDRLFGVSVDGFVGDDGVVEIKTMVSSATLFKAVVDQDVSEYADQCRGALWLLGRQWVDLVLWAPDLAAAGARGLHITRITRDDDQLQQLEDDLLAFAARVADLEAALRLRAA